MRRILLAAAAALIGFVPAVRAEFPERPVTMIMPYAPGAADALMRAVGEHFQRATGQPLVLQTRDGASGVVGMRVVAGAAADGYTLGHTPVTAIAVQPHLLRNAGIGPASFEGVCGTNENVITVAVRADSPMRDLPGLVAEARRRPLSFGSPGPNSLPQLAIWKVQQATGIELNHIPYRGEPPHINDTLAGRLDFSAAIVSSAAELVMAGRMRLLAVFSANRHPDFPDVPTAREQGIDAQLFSQVGIYAPRGTPAPVLDRLESACQAALQDATVLRVLANSRSPVRFVGRAALTEWVRGEYENYGRILRELGVQPE
ncbi:Bug family tripartite tricarboxylate transporter substrate binding protein [Falsiroseomonas stagni]|uniref:Tripartite-type tricarboxylate transporter, receptor component TctC n=1 Tax=Falsiroseomonas stagni DSM 19981 TaxID=1123062 RepID=A0A1I4ERN3_9PROT|nr:tripartite tricarboxylate transporter substrate binding protein [Falsiroseomonas stagni]SFL07770.1 Tripartite-type tricarboxylate transporter, receptor component TctC [Falsiroseomonas stagni DSM 19981]